MAGTPAASCARGTRSPPKDSSSGAPKLWWPTSSSWPATELTPSPIFRSTPSDKSPPIGVCSRGTHSLLSTSWAQASKPCPWLETRHLFAHELLLRHPLGGA